MAVGAAARSVDAAGNTTSRGDGVGLAYDARNRLTEVTLPGGTTRYTYLYNGKGERVGKKNTLAGSPVGASYFVYDEGGRLLGEYTASGAAVAEYLYFNDALYAVATPTDLYYVETDHLGTPRTLVSSARQTVVWSWDALDAKGAFGASAPDADPDHDGVPMVFNLRFPGQYYDAETGLHYNYFRDYEPGTGRYVESDPVGLAGGLSTYGYAEDRPTGAFDFFGLASSYSECCKFARQQIMANPKNKDADGTVACCNGQKVSCVWSEPGASAAPASVIHLCKMKHEDEHQGNAPCPCGCGQNCLLGVPPADKNKDECQSYRVQLACLVEHQRDCGNNQQCRRAITAEIGATLRTANNNYGCGFPAR